MSRTKFDNMVLIIAVVVALFLLTICSCSPRVIANRKCSNGQIQVTTIQFIKICTFTTDFKQGFLTKNKLR